MIRALLGVALSVALVATAAPALEDARTARTDRLVARELGRVETAALALVREEAPGARRTLELTFPGDSPTAAPLTFVALGGVPGTTVLTDTDDRDVFVYRVAGGRRHVRRIGADLRVVRDTDVAASDSQALVLAGGQSYRLTLRLVRIDGRRRVVIEVKKI